MQPTLEDHQDKEALPDVMKVKVNTRFLLSFFSDTIIFRISEGLAVQNGLILLPKIPQPSMVLPVEPGRLKTT